MSQSPNGKREIVRSKSKPRQTAETCRKHRGLVCYCLKPSSLGTSNRWIRKTQRKAGYVEEGCAPDPLGPLGSYHTAWHMWVPGMTQPACPEFCPEHSIPAASARTALNPQTLTGHLSLLPSGSSPASTNVVLPLRVLLSKQGTPSSTHTPHPG